jgi:outer membrane receptor for ferrienterochelin and colicin
VNQGKQYLLNFFAQQQMQFSDRFTMRWGLRTNTDLTTRKTYFQPRFGLEYRFLGDLRAYYLAGLYNQFLSKVKRIDGQGNLYHVWYLPGKNGEGVVTADHNVLGLKYSKNGWLANAELFMRNTRNKNNHLAVPTPTGIDYVYYYFNRKSQEKIRGFDLFFEKKHKNFHHILSYSYARSYEKMEKLYEEQWFPSNNHRTRDLKFTEIITWRNWSFTGAWHISSGLPVLNYADPTNINMDKTGYFSQLDFGLVKKFATRHFYTVVGVSVLNVFDRRNIIEVDFLRFSAKTGSLSLRSDISSLGFTPLFYASFKFW